jgi:tetratricopeptide (TPR) repeat protein
MTACFVRTAFCAAVLVAGSGCFRPAPPESRVRQSNPGLDPKPAGQKLRAPGEPALNQLSLRIDLGHDRSEEADFATPSSEEEALYFEAARDGQAWAQTHLGRIYLSDPHDGERVRRGIEFLQRAAEQNDAEAIYLLAEATADAAAAGPADVTELLTAASQSSAEARAKALDASARFALAKRLTAQRRPAEASSILEGMLEEKTDLPGLHYQAALAAHMAGRKTEAQSLAARALSRGEDSAPLQVLLGVLAVEDKKLAEAAKAFERATRLDPADGIALYNLSEVLREDGRPGEAIEVLQQAQKLEPTRKILALKMRLAQIEAGVGVEELRSEAATRRGKANPSEDWLMTAAAIHLKNGDYAQAAEALRAASDQIGASQTGAILSQDHFFRKFAESDQLADVRQELGLE